MEMPNLIMEPDYSQKVPEEDILLFAYLLGKTPDWRLGKIDSNKLVFFIKWECYQNKEILFRMKFFRDRKGPISPFILDIRKFLRKIKCGREEKIKERENLRPTEFLTLSEKSFPLLDWIEDIARKYPWVFDRMDQYFEKYFGIPWQERQNRVYSLVVNGKTIREYDYRKKERILMPYPPNWNIFSLTEEERKEFWNLFNPQNCENISSIDNNLFFYLSAEEFFSD